MRVLTFLLTALVLSGCATTPQGLDAIRDQASREAVSTSRSGNTLIREAESLAGDAKAQETYRFAPVLTAEAAESLAKARTAQSKGRADDQVRVAALASVATYRKAMDHTLIARETLAPSLAHLEVLNSIRSETYYPSSYADVTAQLNDIIRTLEATGAPASTAQSQRQLLLNMHELEVQTIGFVNLQQIRDRMQAMKDANADHLIPRSYGTAEQALASAEDLIRSTPRAEAEIKTQRQAAKTATDHAQIILAMTNEILDADAGNAEALALRTERWLYNIAVALKYPDIRHLPMDEQSRLLSEAIEEVIQR